MAEYRTGEVLRIALDARVTRDTIATPGWLHVQIADGGHLVLPLSTDPSGDGMDVTRLVPAEGMPQDGELWQDANGMRLLVCTGRYGQVVLSDGQNQRSLANVLEYGPLTPIWQHPRPEQVADEPVTAPIGTVVPGALISAPELEGGTPVHLVNVEGVSANADELRVKYRDRHGLLLSAPVAADTRVTIHTGGDQ
jgi:hypothetical protein